MTSKTLISDSSSLILLAKVDLLGLLCKHSHIFITPEIREEIIFDSYDSALIQTLIATGDITIKSADGIGLYGSLGKGEKTAIALFKKIKTDYLLLDDKKAALYCRQNSLPYINALLIPLYLRRWKVIDEKMMKKKIRLLTQIGYYADWIKEYVIQNMDSF
jgi:predicted nucleic acid-binding protein